MDEYSVRPMRADDAGMIAAHSARYTSALLGFAKYSAEGIANHLRTPGFDPATDGWVVVDREHRFVGSATAMGHGSRVECELLGEDRTVVEWLLDRCLQRATETPDEAPDEVTVTVGVIDADDFLAAVVAGRGFTISTRIHRMRIDHPNTPPAPHRPAPDRPAPDRRAPESRPGTIGSGRVPPPVGVRIRRGDEGESVRRAGHAIFVAAFAGRPSAQVRGYEEWVATREARSTFDWSKFVVLELDGRPVAARECNDNFVASDNCGYIGRLAVHPAARGRGLAKYLLRDAFQQDAAAGRTGTMLHVDTSNPTAALDLYQSVGMRPDITSVIWRKVLKS